MDTKETYVLNRGNFSSLRLTHQHFLWRDHLGWNLHPTILTSIDASASKSSAAGSNTNADADDQSDSHPTLAVADVACGNGLWLMQESQSPDYPPGTKFYGFDISDTQFPSPATIPSNVTVHHSLPSLSKIY
jgi:hypothetical protein